MENRKTRSFGVFLGLSIITLGIYIFYWFYINLKEIKEAFTLNNNMPAIMTAQKLLFFKSITTLVELLVFSLTILSSLFSQYIVILETPSYIINALWGPIAGATFIVFSLISAIVGTFFFYYFTVSVAIAQNKSEITGFDFWIIYAYSIFGMIFVFVGSFVPYMTFSGVILIFLYISKIQQEINKIWSLGKLDKV